MPPAKWLAYQRFLAITRPKVIIIFFKQFFILNLNIKSYFHRFFFFFHNKYLTTNTYSSGYKLHHYVYYKFYNNYYLKIGFKVFP